MNGASPLTHGFVDLAAILFVIGGVVSLAMTILALPITIFPLSLPTSLSASSIVFLGVSLVCSIGAIHCFSLATKRLLSEAGIRGLIFGTLLLIFNIGMTGSLSSLAGSGSPSGSLLTTISAILIMLAGVICFSLRHTTVSASTIARQHAISQPAFQQ